MNLRFIASATASVIPEPANGSRTRSHSSVARRRILSTRSGGKGHSCSFSSLNSCHLLQLPWVGIWKDHMSVGIFPVDLYRSGHFTHQRDKSKFLRRSE